MQSINRLKIFYTKALHKNIANLSLTVTPENSISMNSYGSTRWVFTEFYCSCKPFLILDICGCEVIVIQDIFPGSTHIQGDV